MTEFRILNNIEDTLENIKANHQDIKFDVIIDDLFSKPKQIKKREFSFRRKKIVGSYASHSDVKYFLN